MEFFHALVGQINGVVWGPPMLVLILGTGLFLMFVLRFMPLARIGTGFRLLWQGRHKGDAGTGEISPFAALMTTLAATIGTGNGQRSDRPGPGGVRLHYHSWLELLR